MLETSRMSKPRPIPQAPQGLSSPWSGSSDDCSGLLSKSLNDSRTGLQRRISEISVLVHSGYLLKRSNEPYHPSTPAGPSLQNLHDFFQANSNAQEISAAAMNLGVVCPLPTFEEMEQGAPRRHSSLVEEEKSALEKSLEFAADFFGMDSSTNETLEDESLRSFGEYDVRSGYPPSSSLSPALSSAPPQHEGCDAVPRNSFDQNALHRTISAPPALLTAAAATTVTSISNPSESDVSSTFASDGAPRASGAPADFIDPTDGHLWRSKYCVLEDGVLFFYRNEADAESPEAQLERIASMEEDQNNQTNANNTEMASRAADLSQSPMPRKYMTANFMEGAFFQSREKPVIWEKRVALDCVADVRSAELEFGRNSFQMLAVDDLDGHSDKLVLRARNPEEMKDWLFHFHRSLALFLRNLVDSARISSGEDFFPATAPHSYRPSSNLYVDTMSNNVATLSSSVPIRNRFSPHFHQPPVSITSDGPMLLSHGHGRNALHRRRAEAATTPIASTPSPRVSTPDNGSPLLPFGPTSPTRAFPSVVTPGSREVDPTTSPELSAPLSADPETERPPPSKPQKYLPPHIRKKKKKAYVAPHLRNRQTDSSDPPMLSLSDRVAQETATTSSACNTPTLTATSSILPTAREVSVDTLPESEDDDSSEEATAIHLGGCADPSLVAGSIMDPIYIPRKASKCNPAKTEPFGCVLGGGSRNKLKWEIGAVSECGVRKSNEDAFLIVRDLLSDAIDDVPETWTEKHQPSLFAIFDGHLGDQAARFASERLLCHIADEFKKGSSLASDPASVESILQRAVTNLDREFCLFCGEGGRDWEAGTTALITLLVNEHLVIANIGDCRGVFSRTEEDQKGRLGKKWYELEDEDLYPRGSSSSRRRCVWREVNKPHSPGTEDERARIEQANGWITTEQDIPIAQWKRMHFSDQDVIGILKRCFDEAHDDHTKACNAAPHRVLQISRICGELAVSRALGDRDFKAAYNVPKDGGWDCPQLFLPYPEQHSRCFFGDLVSNRPDFQEQKLGESGVKDEFLLMACDGLWDVMDADDAVRITRNLLFEKQWTAKRAAVRLAELAIHLGSSDNVTVIVIYFSKES